MGVFSDFAALITANKTYWSCYLLGLVVSLVATPFVIRLARSCGAVDRPRHRKIHKTPTPLLGGLSIFVGMWLPLALLAFWDNKITAQLSAGGWEKLAVIFGAGLAMVLTGAVDDKWGLSARWKFLIQFPLAIALVVGGVYFETIRVPFYGVIHLGVLGKVLSVLWIVGVANALNLIDGIDGLAAGVAFFVAGTNAIIALLNGNTILALVMWSMAGACLGFLRYNFSPARIFLGDTGSLFLGITLAVTGMEANSKGTLATSMLIPVLVLGYPVLDTLLAMLRRAVRGKSMFSGDNGHIHHRLLARGLDHKRAALVLYGVCGLFCAVGLASVLGDDWSVGVGLAVIAAVFGAGLWALGYLRFFSHQTLRERPHFKIAFHLSELTKERMKLATQRDQVLGLLREACGEFGMVGLDVSLPDGPLGPAYHSRWRLDGQGGARNSGSGAPDAKASPREERYAFEDTGLAAQVLYSGAGAAAELQMEYRTLLGEVLVMANRRLRELANGSCAPAPVKAAVLRSPRPVRAEVVSQV